MIVSKGLFDLMDQGNGLIQQLASISSQLDEASLFSVSSVWYISYWAVR